MIYSLLVTELMNKAISSKFTIKSGVQFKYVNIMVLMVTNTNMAVDGKNYDLHTDTT